MGKTKIVNGVDLDKLAEAVRNFRKKPELGKFVFTAKNKWIRGGNSRTTINGFFGAGEKQRTDGKRNKSPGGVYSTIATLKISGSAAASCRTL